MIPLNRGKSEADAEEGKNGLARKSVRVRLAGEISNAHCRAGQSVKLTQIAAKYQLNEEAVSRIFAEFQALGMVILSGDSSAVVRSPSPEEMQEAYEIRAALEEIGGRTAARTLKGNTSELQREVDEMRAAFDRR